MRSSDSTVDGAAVVRDFLQNHYHSPSDDLALTIDMDSALKFTRANFLIGLEVAQSDERPSWNEGDFFGKRFAPGRTLASRAAPTASPRPENQ